MKWADYKAVTNVHSLFLSIKLIGREHLEDLRIDGRVILKLIVCRVVLWIYLVRNRNQCTFLT